MFIDVNIGGKNQKKIDSQMRELLLKGVGLLLKTKVRNVDILALYKNQQFAVILPETARTKEISEEVKNKQHSKDTMLVRTAKDFNDYTGGSNNYISLDKNFVTPLR